MITQVFVFLLAGLLAVQANSDSPRTRLSNASPRDLLDDAKQRLAQLRGIVHGHIFEAQGDFGSLGSQFGWYGDSLLQSAQLDIEQQHETITGQLTVLKDSASTADVDVSSCVDIREPGLNGLPDEYIGQITDCITSGREEVTRILQDADYVVDVYMSRVDNLAFQLDQCTAENIVCISPIATQIELYWVQLPQDIRIEVNKVKDLVETQRTSLQQCSDTRVAGYSSESNSILSAITTCVNGLLP